MYQNKCLSIQYCHVPCHVKHPANLYKAVFGGSPVRRPLSPLCGFPGQAVAPTVHHVEALGVPDVCLQPHMLPLAPTVSLQQVLGPSSMSPAGTLALLFCWLIFELK